MAIIRPYRDFKMFNYGVTNLRNDNKILFATNKVSEFLFLIVFIHFLDVNDTILVYGNRVIELSKRKRVDESDDDVGEAVKTLVKMPYSDKLYNATTITTTATNKITTNKMTTDKITTIKTREYLNMGFQSARCLWAQYQKAKTELEKSSVRQRLIGFLQFWAAVIGISIALMWSVFGFFNELFCMSAATSFAEYARHVNRYLITVPPHVVVTNKGKMFWYQPTAEERFLWESAKNIANFKI